MKILLDLQCAQGESLYRGVGRYALSTAEALLASDVTNEYCVLLNGAMPDGIDAIRSSLRGLIPQKNILVWHNLAGAQYQLDGNDTLIALAETMLQNFIASVSPDIYHVFNLFEGYADDVVTTLVPPGTGICNSVTLHDLIPLVNSSLYLDGNARLNAWYQRKLKLLRQADILFAVSSSTASEVATNLGFDLTQIAVTSEAADACFKPQAIMQQARQAQLQRMGLSPEPFVMYVGGADPRKNLPRLIQSFAAALKACPNMGSLVLVGKIPGSIVSQLRTVAAEAGLPDGKLHFTGYVSEVDLVALYNLCHVFIFPSWHEGFGLPVLEAMACGACVICANTTSLPEVVGNPHALFDPTDLGDMARLLVRCFEDDNFRKNLQQHGLMRAASFTWQQVATRMVDGWQHTMATFANGVSVHTKPVQHYSFYRQLIASAPNMAEQLAAKLAQNQLTGHKRTLFVDVSEIRNGDAGTGVQRVVKGYLNELLQHPPAGFEVQPVFATTQHSYYEDHTVSCRLKGVGLGQSVEPEEILPIVWKRGDIFLALDMQHHVQLTHALFFQQLEASGVPVLFVVHDLLPIEFPSFFADPQACAIHEKWLTLITACHRAICVSQSTSDAYIRWIEAAGIQPSPHFQTVVSHNGCDFETSLSTTGISDAQASVLGKLRTAPTFLCVATLEPRKMQDQLVKAFDILWQQDVNVNLVLVGHQGWKVEALVATIANHPLRGKHLFWLNHVSDECLVQLYQTSTCLIAPSLNEGFGLPLIEAAHHGLPVMARDIPVFREIAGESAFYFSGSSPADVAQAVAAWLALHNANQHPLPSGIVAPGWRAATAYLCDIIHDVSVTQRQLLVDVSEIVNFDGRSGIQRVVRNVLRHWLQHRNSAYRVEPVYATLDGSYRYARAFTAAFLNPGHKAVLADEVVEHAPGDVFFGLDMCPQVQTLHADFFQQLRRNGVATRFLLHDLLPLKLPHCFPPGNQQGFEKWLQVLVQADGVVCVSQSVAAELQAQLGALGGHVNPCLTIDWNHNGFEIETDRAADAADLIEHGALLNTITTKPSFLMVGTLEPRKGHKDVLLAFEQLWRQKTDVNLVIVGKRGWQIDELVNTIEQHPEYGHHLYWLAGISDALLEKLYQRSACLIAASEGEGFGLPLVEAAHFRTPILARDIPVFREVAADHATYFPGDASFQRLAQVVEQWLNDCRAGVVPQSGKMSRRSWAESATALAALVTRPVGDVLH